MLNKLVDYADDNYLFEIKSKLFDYLHDLAFDMTCNEVTDNNINDALKLYKALELVNGNRYNLAWYLAWYYEYDDFDLSMDYFNYAYLNSCEYYIPENYAARCIRFADKFYYDKKYDRCLGIIQQAINCVCEHDASEDNYQEYLELITYLADVYSAIGYDEDKLIKTVDAGIKTCQVAINEMRRKREEYYNKSGNQIRPYVSDTEQERAILKLYLIKLKYLIKNKEYLKFKEIYDIALDEIAKSVSTRFYAPLHQFFDEMIKALASDEEDFKFFKDLDNTIRLSFDEKVITKKDIKALLGKEAFIYRMDNKSQMKFVITEILEDFNTLYISAKPQYPLIGEGRMLYFIAEEEDRYYLRVISDYEYVNNTAHLLYKNVITI